jgi:hypothetical protein
MHYVQLLKDGNINNKVLDKNAQVSRRTLSASKTATSRTSTFGGQTSQALRTMPIQTVEDTDSEFQKTLPNISFGTRTTPEVP